MDKKLIQEVSRIREVMYGTKSLLSEQAVKHIDEFYDLLLTLLSKSGDAAKDANRFNDEFKRVRTQIDDMMKAEGGAANT